MKKLLAILLVASMLLCFAACGESGDDNKSTTVATTKANTTTVSDKETTTVVENETTASDEVTTTAKDEQSTTANNEKVTTTKAVAATRPNPADSSNWKQVVNGVFTSDNGGIQLDANGWKTYGLYSISMVPETYNNVGQTNAVCVAVYNLDSTSVFENKTEADFEEVLSADIDSFIKTTISYGGKTYTCYKAVCPDMYYVWVFQTENYKYFINFMQAPGNPDVQNIGENMMKTIRIFK